MIVGGEGGGQLIGGVHRQLGAVLLSPFVSQTLGTLIAKEDGEALGELNRLVEEGSVRPVMGRSYPLADAAEAFVDLAEGRTRGRITVRP